MTGPLNSSIVVGTAGHVDHGKSALVRALTGVDPDRLPEEKRRGMTIELGFANLKLPTRQILSFVDVPGHERFVATMVAGATGIDTALLVVAADESVMPQTREHIAILKLLNVTNFVIAISKVDLIDRDLLPLVEADICDAVKDTPFKAATVVATSAVTGEGLAELVSRLAQPLRQARSALGSPRLPVDRVFTLPGFGTVVTGVASFPGFQKGDEVEIFPIGSRARIRGVHRHGAATDALISGRAALNVAGVDRTVIKRGHVISTPGAISSVSRFDARVEVLAREQPLGRNQLVSVHAGAAATAARVFPLESDRVSAGSAAWVQIRLATPTALWRGQRFVLRAPSATRTIGGGIIADVKPARRARGLPASNLESLLDADPRKVLQALVELRPLSEHSLSLQADIETETLAPILTELTGNGIDLLGARYIGESRLAAMSASVIETLRSHLAGAQSASLTIDEVRRLTRIREDEARALLKRMAGSGLIALTDGSQNGMTVATLPELADRLQVTESESAQRLLRVLREQGLQPEPIDALLRRAGASRQALRRLELWDDVVRIDDWLYISHTDRECLLSHVRRLVSKSGAFSVSALREELGVSRKYALAYAAYLDNQRFTRRDGDLRVAGKNFAQLGAGFAHSA